MGSGWSGAWIGHGVCCTSTERTRQTEKCNMYKGTAQSSCLLAVVQVAARPIMMPLEIIIGLTPADARQYETNQP